MICNAKVFHSSLKQPLIRSQLLLNMQIKSYFFLLVANVLNCRHGKCHIKISITTTINNKLYRIGAATPHVSGRQETAVALSMTVSLNN